MGAGVQFGVGVFRFAVGRQEQRSGVGSVQACCMHAARLSHSFVYTASVK